MTGLSEQQRAEIQERADAATAGPWGSHRDLDGVYTVQARPRIAPGAGNTYDGDVATVYTPGSEGQTYANARFIAMARESVPALLAEVARLREERDQFANRVDTLTSVAKGNKRHVTELMGDLSAAQSRVAELEAERHSTNEALSEAAEAIREKDARLAELERSLRAARQAKSEYHDDLAGALGYPHADWADLIDLAATNTATIAKAGGPDGR